jgi:molecular chaperone DnaJ
VQVQTPTRLSKEQKELLRQFDALCQGEEEGFFSRLFGGGLGKQKKKKADKEEKVAHG